VSVGYPASFTSNEDRKDGIWYRYFLSPGQGPERRSALAVTLLVGPFADDLEAYAEGYLAGNAAATREVERSGVKGREYEYASGDAATRYRLILLPEAPRIYGLYAQGPAASWEAQRATLERIATSFALERPKLYRRTRDAAFGFSIGVPRSWRESRRFASKDTLLLQFQSPPLAMDAGGQTVHASLTLTVEPAPEPDDLDAYYEATLKKLGEAFKVMSHDPWADGRGYVDVMLVESAMSESRVKRFFTVLGPRAYSISFESREDVFPRFHRWADFIAASFVASPPGVPPAAWPSGPS
jgi:hypothetical protein